MMTHWVAVPLLALVLHVLVAPPAARADELRFKKEFLPHLVRAVPKLLASQDKATGRFCPPSDIWIVQDQHALFPLAAAWAIEDSSNPHYHSTELLDAIMAGGDALIDDQDAKGMWVFRKKDGSTWGDIYMPWTYSRWVRAYGLIKDAMPSERRARWETALTLGYDGIARTALKSVHNIPAHHAMGLYHAGQVLNRRDWCEQAAAFMKKVVAAQDAGGFWSENSGPVVGYNFVYTDSLGTYYAMSRDETVLPALQRASTFHAAMTYPNGSSVETVDERQVYKASTAMPNVGFTFSPQGRGYVARQWGMLVRKKAPLSADMAASYLLYGQEGDAVAPPAAVDGSRFVLGDNDAMTLRQGPWFACLSAYHTPVPANRWIQDRQNLVSLFHDKVGVIVGGGNTKLQPLWSTFVAGNPNLLKHTPGDQSPNFAPPGGVWHVPAEATLDPEAARLSLAYGPARCRVSVDVSNPDAARLVYELESPTDVPVEAHVVLLAKLKTEWRTSRGTSGTLGEQPLRLAADDVKGWFGHNGWRISVPPGASVVWPALPHNPYVKDGSAKPAEGRIVLVLPFTRDVMRHEVTIEVP